MVFNKKFTKIIAICTLVCLMISALASCNLLGTGNGTQNPSGNSGTGGSNKPSGNGGSGSNKPGNTEKEEEIFYDKGIFFDSAAADGGDGSFEAPYNSLDVIETLEISAGAYIYIKRGSEFTGSLKLANIHGTEEEPVVVTAYDKGNKPKIDGNDLSGTGVLYILNCDNITVENLEIYDSATTEADRRGVLVVCNGVEGSEEIVTYKNIKLKNLYVHDILGHRDAENSGMSMESKITGGIHLWSNDGLGRVDGFEITGCEIAEVSNVGIATWQQVAQNEDGTLAVSVVSPYSKKFNDVSHANVSINNNEVHHIGKNAIFARNLYGGVIEYNVVHDTAIHCVSGNSIVTRSVDGTVIQYNEGYRNMAKPREKDGVIQDGSMLDADLDSKDTIWQYNYSHDNSFGLFLNCTNATDTVIVRYNLSVNDRGQKGIIYINYESAGIYVYNNTIVTSYTTEYIIQSNNNRTSYFYNNLIYNRSDKAKFSVASSGMTAANNLIYNEYGSSIQDTAIFDAINVNGIYDQDPLFSGYLQEDSIPGIDNQLTYILDNSSPALGVGFDVDPVKDYFGNEYSKSIGFYCGRQ